MARTASKPCLEKQAAAARSATRQNCRSVRASCWRCGKAEKDAGAARIVRVRALRPENGACFPGPPSLRAFRFCLRLCRPVLWRQRLSRETSTEKAQKLAETSRETRNTVLLNLTVFPSLGVGIKTEEHKKKAQTRKHEHKKKHQKSTKKRHKLGNTSTKKSTRKSTRKKHKLVNTLAVKSTRKAQKKSTNCRTHSQKKAPGKAQKTAQKKSTN